MRVLLVHNRYREPGAEDTAVSSEIKMLQEHGVEVLSAEFDQESAAQHPLRAGWDAAWSEGSYRKILDLCRQLQPEVAHVHNFWPEPSPSVHAACHAARVPTVQTLYNFRLMCVNGSFFRAGVPCEDCLGRGPWRGVVHRCYQGSLTASAAMARMIGVNRKRGTWERDVDAFIALSDYARSKFIAIDLSPGRIFVKPDFVEDAGIPESWPSASKVIVYVGLLSREKGIATLLSAWLNAGLSSYGQLVIAGDGPDRSRLESLAARGQVSFVGPKKPDEISQLLASARALVLPSLSEDCPRIVLEALSHGRPVIAFGWGGVPELVSHGQTGLLAAAGKPQSLATVLLRILKDVRLADRLGANARADYEERFTPERNYKELMEIYQFAIGCRRRAAAPGSALAETSRSHVLP